MMVSSSFFVHLVELEYGNLDGIVDSCVDDVMVQFDLG